jgi:4-diphosphocytidyl-2-C-methyl-D-erythritol kinase
MGRGHGSPPRALRIEAHAKLNLGLAVGPRRTDGFHDLVTVFQSVSLADTLEIEPRPRRLSLSIRFAHARDRVHVPRGPKNLVLRAARLVRERLGISGGAHLRLTKRIPAGAGLGGGSADAAAALVGFARLHGIRLGRSRRIALASELGSDVPFAATGGTALGMGRGEVLRPLRLAGQFRAAIAIPAWRISTPAAFARIDRSKCGLTVWRAKLRFGQSLGREEVRAEQILRLGNTFEAALGSRRLQFQALCERLVRAGVRTPHLTGSGSAVFGILDPGCSEKSVVTCFQGREQIFVVRAARTGLRITTMR